MRGFNMLCNLRSVKNSYSRKALMYFHSANSNYNLEIKINMAISYVMHSIYIHVNMFPISEVVSCEIYE